MSGGDKNWGDHVNETRKDSCFDCGEFHEPENLTFNEDAQNYLCPSCDNARWEDVQREEQRRHEHGGI